MARVQKTFSLPSMTKQSFKDETNVNNIMAKYLQTGLLDHVNEHQGQYGDFVTAPDYHTAMNAITAANQSFDSLPSPIRSRFANDPAKFLEFVQNPENEDEMRSLGLLPTPSAASNDPAAAPDPAPEPPGAIPAE